MKGKITAPILAATLAVAMSMAAKADVEPTPTPVLETPVPISTPLPTPEPTPIPTPTPTPEPTPVPTPEPTPEPAYTEEELEILAIIVYQEAGGDYCSDSTRQMVGEVFLNRVADDRFPDTFAEVATARAQYGRLHWTGVIWPERAVNPGEAHAVQRAYDCAEALLSGSAERLLPSDVVFQAEFPQNEETVAFVDGIYFCR